MTIEKKKQDIEVLIFSAEISKNLYPIFNVMAENGTEVFLKDTSIQWNQRLF